MLPLVPTILQEVVTEADAATCQCRCTRRLPDTPVFVAVGLVFCTFVVKFEPPSAYDAHVTINITIFV